jgi:hypothetical protein
MKLWDFGSGGIHYPLPVMEENAEPVFNGYIKGGCLPSHISGQTWNKLSPDNFGNVTKEHEKIVTRQFWKCDKGTRENCHQTIFECGKPAENILRIFSRCNGGV